MRLHTIFRLAVGALVFASAVSTLHAQSKFDLGVTYAAMNSETLNSNQKFWLQGGSVELGVGLWGKLGLAANLTGVHTNSIGSGNVPLSMLIGTAGPRVRFGSRKASVYVEALFGEANGFHSQFPTAAGLASSATAFAMNAGGGIDFGLSHHVALRAINADYVYTKLPNTSNNSQGSLLLSSGLVFRF